MSVEICLPALATELRDGENVQADARDVVDVLDLDWGCVISFDDKASFLGRAERSERSPTRCSDEGAEARDA